MDNNTKGELSLLSRYRSALMGIAVFVRNVPGVNFYTKSIYSFLWFVPAIATLYFVFPWYYKLLEKCRSPIKAIICTILIWLLVSVAARHSIRRDKTDF